MAGLVLATIDRATAESWIRQAAELAQNLGTEPGEAGARGMVAQALAVCDVPKAKAMLATIRGA